MGQTDVVLVASAVQVTKIGGPVAVGIRKQSAGSSSVEPRTEPKEPTNADEEGAVLG